MTVKDRVGRQRYIAFIIEAPREFRRGEVIHAIHRALPRDIRNEDVWLTVFEHNAGIVRCPHLLKDRVIEILNGIREVGGVGVTFRTVITSGTIKKAKKKFQRKTGIVFSSKRPPKKKVGGGRGRGQVRGRGGSGRRWRGRRGQ